MKPLLATAVLLSFCNVTLAQTSLQRVASGLSSPLYGTHAPDDTNRMFWLQQGSGGTGQIIVQDLGTGVRSTFMSISGLTTGGEQGLLGLAFDPDYANNGHFYTYVSTTPLGNRQSQVRRYTALGNPATSNQGNPASLETLMSFSQPFSNHNGGWIGFNPKVNAADPQYLYIASGDGGSGGDPGDRSQDITNQPLGKMLRIDVSSTPDPGLNYAIPASNPFVNQTGDDEIWAYGLRNPWRNSFDRENGDLWIGDVGQGVREEINHQPGNSPGGENYGWRVMEGNNCFNNNSVGPPCFDPSLTDPVYDYAHNGGNFGGFSVTGGYVYRGSIPQYQGLYFFADFSTENIWSLDPNAADPSSTVVRRNTELLPNLGSINGIPSFAENADGEMYLISFSGNIYEFSSTSRRAEWNGDDAGAGGAGDGTTWTQGANWTRDGNVDTGVQDKDEVAFVPGSSSTILALGGDRRVGGVVFEEGYTLTGNQLTVLSGNVRVANGVTARIDSTLASETSNSSIRKLGAGKLLIGGNSAQMALLEGSVGGTGTLANLIAKGGTTVAPGNSIGILTIDADFVQEAGSTLEIEVDSPSAVDQLAVADDADLAGDVSFIVDASFTAGAGTIVQLAFLTAADIEGAFDTVLFNGSEGTSVEGALGDHVGEGQFVSVNYTDTDASLQSYFALAGDANGDGFVNGRDFLIWNASKGQSGTDWLSGDFNGDGMTDATDFGIWNSNKFTQIDFGAVPEPSSYLAIMGIAALLFRRKI